jgi:hypothetical protein
MSFRNFSLREQNSANCMANKGRSGGSTTCWLHQIPDCISRLVLANCKKKGHGREKKKAGSANFRKRHQGGEPHPRDV